MIQFVRSKFDVLGLRTLGRRTMPAVIRQMAQYVVNGVGRWKTNLYLARLRLRVWNARPGSLVKCLNYTVRINDGPNFYILYKDIFIQHIYHFEAQRPDPFILDCGSNIGMSILYFKHVYPKARIIGFEPDPAIFPILEENIARNGLTDVRLVRSALAGQEGTLTFYSDGKYGSCLAHTLQATSPKAGPSARFPACGCRIT